jgi:hypothetical protein
MTDENTSQNETPSNWFIDEGMPGIGERPAWLNEKFKTVADLAKSYSELEKRVGTAPDEYDFSKSKYIDPDYVPFEDLKQLAKDKRVPQEVMDKMLDSFDKYMDEFRTDYDEEIKKLGDDGKERLTILNNWAKANLSKDSYEALTSSMNTAESVKALEELRGKMMTNAAQVPTGNSGNVESATSIDDLKIELSNNLEKYKTNSDYRKDYQKRLEVAAKNQNSYVDKMGA